MNKKWVLIIIIILTIVNLSTLGTFCYKRWCRGRMGHHMNDDKHFNFLKKELRLTDEQAAKMKDFREEFHPRMEAISQTIKDKKEDLVKELLAESPDSARIEQILLQMDSSQSTLHREVVSHLLLEKNIFTPEQQEKFFSIVLEPFSGEKKPFKKGDKNHE